MPLFTLVANSESSGKAIGVKDGNLYIGTPEEFYWHADANHDGTTAERAYIISSTKGLDLLAKQVNNGTSYGVDDYGHPDGYFFKLANDIIYDPNVLTIDNDDNGTIDSNYTPIGFNSSILFQGTFDGCGKTISGIRIYLPDKNDQGLFSGIKGIVKNVTVSNADITGRQAVGGIVGYIEEEYGKGIIENCHVTSSVTIRAVVNDADVHGGIVGRVSSGIVSGCTSAATLTKADGLTHCDSYGGIVGENGSGTISGCASAATVNGRLCVGGIVGYNGSGTISGCTSAATVNGESRVGGIAGDNDIGASIEGCLVNGASISASNSGGAIVGLNNVRTGILSTGILSCNYYSNCTVTIAGGTAQTSGIGCGDTGDGTNTPTDITSMTVDDVTYTDCAVPVPSAPSLTLVQGTKNGVTAWWGTYYHSALRFTLPEGATAYTMDSNHQLYRLGTDGRTIPAGVAVVIISDKQDITLTLDTGSATVADHSGGNILRGGPATVTDGKVDGKTPYVLGVANGVAGFYKYTGTSIPYSKAYLLK